MNSCVTFVLCATATIFWSRRKFVKELAHNRGLYSLCEVRPHDPPLVLEGRVAKGFGRGGKLLNCPTANLRDEDVGDQLDPHETGVYFGWIELNGNIYKMATSIGWNPFFKNDKKTVEAHILHEFDADFYGERVKMVLCGYIRPELDFPTMESLIEAIENDKVVSNLALDLPKYDHFKSYLK